MLGILRGSDQPESTLAYFLFCVAGIWERYKPIWKLSFADDVNFSFVACKNVPADRNANFHRAFRLRKMLGFLAFLLHLLGKLALSYVTMACDIQDGVLSLCAS